MSRIHKASNVALLPQLSLWDVPDTQESIIKDVEYEIRPISTFSSSTPMRFEVRSPENEYMLFNESHLWLKLKITLSKENGKIEGHDWAHVYPVNNFFHSIFKHVSLLINNREVTVTPSNYSYRAFIENFLAFADSAKRGRLSSVGWSDEEFKRRKIITDGVSDDPAVSIIDFEGMLNLDLTFQEKALPGDTQIILELIPNQPSFYLPCANGIKASVEFLETAWYVHKAQVSPATLDGLRYGFSKAPARYCVTRSDVRHASIPANVYEYTLENIVMGTLPRRVILGLVSSEAFNGTSVDPFAFQHFNVNYLSAFIDGNAFPLRPYTPDFRRNNYVREFRALYRALNQTGTETYLELDRSAFKARPLFAFNFAPDLSNGGSFSSHVNLKTQGHLRLQLKFSEKLPSALVAVIYCEFDSCIEIDSMRNVHIDY